MTVKRPSELKRVGWVLSVVSGLALGLASPAVAQTIAPSVGGTLVDGGAYGAFDGTADGMDWTFNQSSYEGAVTLASASGVEHRVVFEYDLGRVVGGAPVEASLSFALRGAPVYPMPDVVVQVYAYAADLQKSMGDFSAAPAALLGSATVHAYQPSTVYAVDASSAVNAALANGSKKVGFRLQIDPGTGQPANQAFIDASDANPTSKPMLTLSAPSSPAIVAAVSRKAHGTAGTFDIDVASSSAIESRRDGATEIVVSFSKPIQRLTGTLQDVAVSQGAVTALTASGNTLAIGLTGTAGSQAVVLSFPGIADAQNAAAVLTQTLCIRVLPGDASGDGSVNTSDYVAIRGRMGQEINASNCRYDVNADGSINTSDFISIRSRIGTSAGVCP